MAALLVYSSGTQEGFCSKGCLLDLSNSVAIKTPLKVPTSLSLWWLEKCKKKDKKALLTNLLDIYIDASNYFPKWILTNPIWSQTIASQDLLMLVMYPKLQTNDISEM